VQVSVIETNTFLNKMFSTNDFVIRCALKDKLETQHAKDRKVRIIEELGVHNGNARVDIAVVNGIMHGYEIKSDQDTLNRLPEQVQAFSSVFDKVTLVVGKLHLYEAINIVPDWWGVTVAKADANGSVDFMVIRREDFNQQRDSVSIARLLWREEALRILEAEDAAKGFRSKPRGVIYQQLSTVLDQETLGRKVREAIFVRPGWRPDAPLMLSGG